MNVRAQLSPHCVDARYKPATVPHFMGNPLIEALPPALEPEQALVAYSSTPAFSPEQRDLSVAERLQMLKRLSNFMVPLERHVAFTSELDSMLRNGYVGRAPATPEYVRRMQSLYEARQTCFEQDTGDDYDAEGQQLSMLLMGISGMGKTRLTKRWAARLPKVVYHEELHVYQIPVLHIELPSDGESLTGFCNSVFRAIDKLVPGANYLDEFGMKGRPTVAKLIPRLERILHMHCVGMLICDEVQNLTNSGKTQNTVMTELVTLSNVLNLPIVFIGTNKSEDLFGLEFRKSRRVSGFGGEHWDRLKEATFLEDGRVQSEWREFLEVLWQYQWTKNPIALTEELLANMYWCCQGVLDTAIKMFAAMQARAILDGTEVLSKELMLDVYKRDFKLMHPMMDALRNDDPAQLALYADIRPLSMDTLLTDIQSRARSRASKAYTTKPETPGFVARVATALTASGFDAAEAVGAATEVAAAGTAKNLIEATQQGIAKLTPRTTPSKSKNRSAKTQEQALVAPEPTGRPGDLRYAVKVAQFNGTKVLEHLRSEGLVKSLEELLDVT